MAPRVVGALLALRLWLAWGATCNGNRTCPKVQGSVLLQTERQKLRTAQAVEDSQLQGLGRFTAYVNGSAPWPEDVNPVIDVDIEGRPIFHPAFLAASPSRTASNHLWYHGKSGQQWWYNQVTVKESSDVSYFSVNGHRFGYFGIQMVRKSPFHGRIVCSIWDQLCRGDNAAECPEEKRVEVLECGAGVTCTRFGGEGTGAKSQWEWNDWQVGKTYGFMTEIKPVGDDRMETSCWLHAEELGGWKVLSRMEVNRNGKPATIHGYYSFVEQWTSAGFGDAREATYGPTFTHTDAAASTPWSQILEATYTHGSHPTESTAHVHGYTASNVWGLASGTDYEYTPTNTRLPRVIASSPPLPLMNFAELAANGSIPRGLPPSKAAASPIFLQPPNGMGCFGITKQAVLERRLGGENCEEFELDASGELVQSRASSLCLELLGSDVVLKHCDPGREAQQWGGDGLTEFCNSGTCLRHTSTKVRLAHPSGGCYGGRPGALLYKAGAEDSEDCPWFSYQGEENSNEFEVMLGRYCVDLFSGRGLGLYSCHGGSNQKLRRFDEHLCVGAHTQGNYNNCAKIIGFVAEAAVTVSTTMATSTSTPIETTTTTTSSLVETTMATTTTSATAATDTTSSTVSTASTSITSMGPSTTLTQTTTAPSFSYADGGQNRACRGATSLDNAAQYYILYSGVLDLETCMTICVGQAGCVGIEFSKGRCEVWTRPEGIGATAEVSGFQCLRYTQPAGTVSTTSGPSSFSDADGGQNRACRGATSADNAAHYYDVHRGTPTLETCKAVCVGQAGCVGIEFSKGRCEVWTRPEGIGATAEVSGFQCLRYVPASE